jgi:FdhD protein
MSPPDGAMAARVLRVSTAGVEHARPELLAIEEPLEIQLDDGGGLRSVAVLMRTPTEGADGTSHDEELALGFLCSEGVIARLADVVRVAHCTTAPSPEAEGNVLQVRLAADVRVDWRRLTRHTFASSSCGLCGKATLESALQTASPLPDASTPRVRWPAAALLRAVAALPAHQPLFGLTGAVHGVALADEDGGIVLCREDVGRHNAMDKVIGAMWRRGLDPHRHAAIVSGRVSFELVQKALAARLPIIAGVSAPTGLAVRLGEAAGMAVVGFVRGERLQVYSHPDRLRC